jgi:hypothetical protein
VRSACDSERPTTVTHGQSWSLSGRTHESAESASMLVRALDTSPKLVVRGRVELPTFRSVRAYSRRAPPLLVTGCGHPAAAEPNGVQLLPILGQATGTHPGEYGRPNRWERRPGIIPLRPST